MSFWVMLISFVMGLALFFAGIFRKGRANLAKRICLILLGILAIGFAVYIAWPK